MMPANPPRLASQNCLNFAADLGPTPLALVSCLAASGPSSTCEPFNLSQLVPGHVPFELMPCKVGHPVQCTDFSSRVFEVKRRLLWLQAPSQ